MSPRVSVLMPARNAERFVAEQVRCVLAQDHASFELVACDNGSADGTWAELERFRGDPRVRLLRNAVGTTVGAVRNRLLREARGAYVMPCDADDWLLPGSVSRLARFLDRHPAVGYCYGSFLMLETGRGRRLQRAPWVRGRQHDPGADLFEFTANHAGALLRRELALGVGGYDEDTPLDSVSLTLKLAEVTQLRLVPGALTYVYRRRARGGRRPDWARAFLSLARRARQRRATRP
ncbi:MAG: glycosyltransferase family 2 protein [Vicinamibacteria bacterium]|nr:glycosyltransferase family 2 protein [Vicinamibacteria bacterium]